MKLQRVVVGPIQTNCYLLEDAGELVVIDPGDNLERILGAVGERNVSLIVATHGHWDHVGAVAGLQHETGATFAISASDAPKVDGVSRLGEHDVARGFEPMKVGRRLREGDVVNVGSVQLSVIETPGHTPGSICLYCSRQKILFAGDTLFAGGSYGRTDFEDGSFSDIVTSIRRKLARFPDDVVVCCGHGDSSTIGAERALNPLMQVSS